MWLAGCGGVRRDPDYPQAPLTRMKHVKYRSTGWAVAPSALARPGWADEWRERAPRVRDAKLEARAFHLARLAYDHLPRRHDAHVSATRRQLERQAHRHARHRDAERTGRTLRGSDHGLRQRARGTVDPEGRVWVEPVAAAAECDLWASTHARWACWA